MTQREKILASGVAFVLLLLIGQWGFNKYKTAVSTRQEKILSMNGQIGDLEVKLQEGAMAEARAGEYAVRSLSSDREQAQTTYTAFLLDVFSKSKLGNRSVNSTPSRRSNGLYSELDYSVSGTGSLEQILAFLHEFYKVDYLHRISSLSINKRQDTLYLELKIQAMVMDMAPVEAQTPAEPSPLVASSFDAYLRPIMNRNPMSPPNQRPSFAADRSIEATKGEDFTYVVRFNDPDPGQQLSYELIGDAPAGLRFDEESGRLRLRPEETGRIELKVRATDNGWPTQSTEERFVINVVDPPAAPAPVEKPTFDEASQTFLTGLTQSRGKWMAMLHIRTQGKTLKLHEGDDFQVGEMKGQVVELTDSFAVLEREGERFVLSFDASLADAWKNSAP